MITFRVAKEVDGWTVRVGRCTSTPFRTRDVAVTEAQCLAGELRAHGQISIVAIDDVRNVDAGAGGNASATALLTSA